MFFWAAMYKGARLYVLMIMTAMGIGIGGCSSIATPPAYVHDPVPVLIVRDGIHTGLVLPCSESTYVEYGYGDWDWYALNKDQWYHVFDTVLWPTQGALARRIYMTANPDSVLWLRGSGRGEMLYTSRRRVDSLCTVLHLLYESARTTEVYNPAIAMHLVKLDRGFWWYHNCADAVAEWLQALGCTVEPALIRGGITVHKGPS